MFPGGARVVGAFEDTESDSDKAPEIIVVQEKQQTKPTSEDEGKEEFEYDLQQALQKSFSEGGPELGMYYDFCTDRHSSDVLRQVDEYDRLSADLKGTVGSDKEDSRRRKSLHK